MKTLCHLNHDISPAKTDPHKAPQLTALLLLLLAILVSFYRRISNIREFLICAIQRFLLFPQQLHHQFLEFQLLLVPLVVLPALEQGEHDLH